MIGVPYSTRNLAQSRIKLNRGLLKILHCAQPYGRKFPKQWCHAYVAEGDFGH